MTAGELLIQIEPANEHILGSLAPDDDLLAAGIDSASLVELALRIEEECGVALRAAELDSLTTLSGIQAVLERHRPSGERPAYKD
jgi:acyl carrier protein